ncbi:MAG: PAS domain S-box protein [Pseudomonadota bacterium]
MADDEALREALIELEALRRREATALRESNALVNCLSAVATARTPEAALARLLDAIRDSVECAVVAIVGEGEAGGDAKSDDAKIRVATDAALIDTGVPAALLKGRKTRRIVALADVDWWSARDDLPAMGSLVAAPMRLGTGRGALVCFARERDAFSVADAKVLPRLAKVAAQALATLELSRRNAFLAGVIDKSAVSVSVADIRTDGMPLIYVNDAFTALTGYSRDDALGQNCRFLSAEPQDSPVRTALRNAVASASVGEFELRNRRRDGEFFWNRLSLYPIDGEDGAPRFLVATQVDISAEKNAEAARETASRRLRSALSTTSEGFLLLTPEGRIVFANDRYRDFFETQSGGWDDGADFVKAWAGRLRDLGEEEHQVVKASRLHRDELFAGARDKEVTLPDGRVLLMNNRTTTEGGVVSIATNITSLKATERILAQRAAAIDASQDGVAVADDEGRLLYANQSYLQMYGYEHQYELLGKSWRIAFPEDQWERVKREAIPALQEQGSWRAELPGVSKAGDQVLQEVSVTYAPGVGVVCIARDMRQRAKARSERARLIEQLQAAQRQEAIGQLAAGVAHDFNNVLSAITGSASLIEGDLERGRSVADHVERILQAGEQAQGLVKRLLNFGARRSEKSKLDLRDAVGEGVDLLRSGVPPRIELTFQAPDAPIMAQADPTDLMQIILNLGINARDAIGADAGRIAIEVAMMSAPPSVAQVGAVDPEGEYARILVADTGAGMTGDQIDGIFRAYFSTKGDRGTGLGLSVVSTIVRNLGGAIEVASTPGAGSEFAIYYPLAEVAEAGSVRRAAPDVSADLSGRLILICDDNIGVAETHAALLENAGAETAVVDDPRDALEALTEDPDAWDALLTDFDMPHMDGAALATAAKAARADLPVVLCTAFDLHQRSGAVFDGELEKPAEPGALISTLAAAIKAHQTADN